MPPAFIRLIYGDCVKNQRLNLEIQCTLKHRFSVPFRTYVFGTDNLHYLQDLGLDCRLIGPKPREWGPQQIYRHKLEA